MTSILSIVSEEMKKHNVHRLLKVHVCYGNLTNIVAESLQFAFSALTQGTKLEGASLETKEIPLKLKCLACSHTFEPQKEQEAFFLPCPSCNKQKSFTVSAGRELFIDYIDAI